MFFVSWRRGLKPPRNWDHSIQLRFETGPLTMARISVCNLWPFRNFVVWAWVVPYAFRALIIKDGGRGIIEHWTASSRVGISLAYRDVPLGVLSHEITFPIPTDAGICKMRWDTKTELNTVREQSTFLTTFEKISISMWGIFRWDQTAPIRVENVVGHASFGEISGEQWVGVLSQEK